MPNFTFNFTVMANFNPDVGGERYRSFFTDSNSLNLEVDYPVDNYQSFNNLKYFNCKELNSANSSLNFDFYLFHFNISSLSRHFDELKTTISFRYQS